MREGRDAGGGRVTGMANVDANVNLSPVITRHAGGKDGKAKHFFCVEARSIFA